ncbi:endopeptidase [Brenneria goodwinii]|uniref:Endopeptidase n=1 Tax=Brenneria goodwinii TaxID=1109412 RepID=A0AAE8JP74_9GAMM|nr:C40 family peptidase [Brenneria goodwinii]ATA23781.1 endopeptidase [Brenneria goodwinii]MCG8155721.1 C40 family peptidase [Brenneria goodwinii]MCG8160553.1 C40 family peptidase [Brenneria goodwinii]MCG8166345.1 C40 family peptidase [Brenneria goodwinii]MCG8171093.1 C40 family peptidase [Brenneria goodwinii]
MRLFTTLFILFFSNLFLNLAQAAPHTPNLSPRKASVNSVPDGNHKKTKQTKKSPSKSPTPVKNKQTAANKTNSPTKIKILHVAKRKPEPALSRTKSSTPALVKRNLIKRHAENDSRQAAVHTKAKPGLKGEAEKGLTLSEAHKKRYQHAKLTAMNKLMGQVGKPYHWGGSSPFTGFDCSGLVYYAYKDVVKISIPRTANEMYHLRDAAPIKKSELESGDLVFFRINNRGAADHVGVYLGDGKFIQSPRTGSDIRISKLSEDYWQDHYVGARRVVTPQTIR